MSYRYRSYRIPIWRGRWLHLHVTARHAYGLSPGFVLELVAGISRVPNA